MKYKAYNALTLYASITISGKFAIKIVINIVSKDLQKLVKEYIKIKASSSDPISEPSKITLEKIPKINNVENNNKIILEDFSIIFTNLYKLLKTSLKFDIINKIFNKLFISVFSINSNVSIKVKIKEIEKITI